jgi:hypothetical protein
MLFTWATSFKRHAKSSVLTSMTDTDTSQYLPPSVPSLQTDWLLGSNVSKRQYTISPYIFGDDIPLCCCNAVWQNQFSALQLLCICNGLNCFLYTWISVSYYAQRLNSSSFTTHRKVFENVQMDNRNESVLCARIYWKLLSIILSL